MLADIAELHIDDIGTFRLHEEGKLMDFDITVVPQGGMYKCAYLACLPFSRLSWSAAASMPSLTRGAL
jgi:hypothetical protein